MNAPGPEEEPWEADVHGLLWDLPDVEPPPGFLAAAVDHRPMHAGRIFTSLVAIAVLGVGATVGVALAADGTVTPELDALARQHLVAERDLGGDDAADVLDSDARDAVLGIVGPDVPDSYVPAGHATRNELRQAVFDLGAGEAVSVFVTAGAPDWDAMGSTGHRREVDGAMVWSDDQRQITVVQAGHDTAVIVGVDPDDAADLIAAVAAPTPSATESMMDHITAVAGRLAGPFGFPTAE
ncbi:MAG: hypothetical protein AAF467_06760 [Actinomycetota bacterium]